ncbi:hypothetical protein KAU19_02220 [Candidatus Parcubacteria bacterium]|nr:hypothetical protein [Candidatus Parcubacteria bacterium]
MEKIEKRIKKIESLIEKILSEKIKKGRIKTYSAEDVRKEAYNASWRYILLETEKRELWVRIE